MAASVPRAVLAIGSGAHASTFAARWENDAVDSLPYADELPEGWRDHANQLVAEEARSLCFTHAQFPTRDPWVCSRAVWRQKGATYLLLSGNE